jgi:hypothetical protein
VSVLTQVAPQRMRLALSQRSAKSCCLGLPVQPSASGLALNTPPDQASHPPQEPILRANAFLALKPSPMLLETELIFLPGLLTLMQVSFPGQPFLPGKDRN